MATSYHCRLAQSLYDLIFDFNLTTNLLPFHPFISPSSSSPLRLTLVFPSTLDHPWIPLVLDFLGFSLTSFGISFDFLWSLFVLCVLHSAAVLLGSPK